MREIRQLELSELKEIFQKYMKTDFPMMELRPWFSIERTWERGGYEAYGYYEDDRLLAYASFYTCRDTKCVLFDYLAVMSELRGRGIGSEFLGKLLPEAASGRLSEVLSGLPLGSPTGSQPEISPGLRSEDSPAPQQEVSPGLRPEDSPAPQRETSPEEGIFGEVESVSSAKDEEERGIRQKRIDFYLRNGAVMTGVSCHLFGVDYNILSFRAGKRGTAKDEIETAEDECEVAEDESETEADACKAAADAYYDVICAMYREIYRPVYGKLCRPYRDGEE